MNPIKYMWLLDCQDFEVPGNIHGYPFEEDHWQPRFQAISPLPPFVGFPSNKGR